MRHLHTAVLFLLGCGFSAHAQGLVLKYQETIAPGQSFDIVSYLSARLDFGQESDWFDLDGNGIRDLVVGRTPCNFIVYGMPGMSVLWESPVGESQPVFEPFFLDVDGDSVKEIFYASTPGCAGGHVLSIYSLLHNTNVLQSDPLVFYNAAECSFISDYDGDDRPDVMFVVGTLGGARRFEIWGAGTVASSPPSDLVFGVEEETLILHWQPVDSCSMYRVYWSFALNGEYASVGTSCTPSFTHPGAAIAPLAYYRVVAITSTNDEQVVAQAEHRKKTLKR